MVEAGTMRVMFDLFGLAYSFLIEFSNHDCLCVCVS